MSDAEEPPAKVTKINLQVDSATLDLPDSQDEGQEEWLSEGLLTDDDYNPTGEHDRSDSNLDNTSQEDSTMPSINENSIDNLTNIAEEPKDKIKSTESITAVVQNIEQKLNNLENRPNSSQTKLPTLSDDLDTFLIRKTDGKVVEKKISEQGDKESDIDESVKNSDEEDDGHNTDDLLRMLGEGDEKVNKNVVLKTIKQKAKERGESKKSNDADDDDDDDDDYIFEGAKVTRLKVSKNVLLRKATKAQPEDMSDKDSDSDELDEVRTMQKMFGVAKPTSKVKKVVVNVSKTSSKPPVHSQPTTIFTKQDARLPSKPETTVEKPQQKPPVKQYTNKAQSKLEARVKTETPKKEPKEETEEIINEEEFLEEDEFDLDEELMGESHSETGVRGRRQRIMRPERMDEEPPSDADSNTDDDSFYDELPSSESDELDDWFTLDLRAERAGEYLPLLGTKAKQLLEEEKRRVNVRLEELRKSLSALTDSGKQQAEQLRQATVALAELDAMLAAS